MQGTAVLLLLLCQLESAMLWEVPEFKDTVQGVVQGIREWPEIAPNICLRRIYITFVINPYKLALLLTDSRDKAFLVKSIQAYSRHCTVRWSLLSIRGGQLPIEISAPNNLGTHARTNFVHVNKWYSVHTRIRQIVHPNTRIFYPVVNVYPVIPYKEFKDIYWEILCPIPKMN